MPRIHHKTNRRMKPTAQCNNWYAWKDDQTRLRYDPCAQTIYEAQSLRPGHFNVCSPGLRSCEPQTQYANHMSEPLHYQKQYRSSCYVNDETNLIHAPLTNQRYINQFGTRPYLGQFQGAGQRSPPHLKDVESVLTMGFTTTNFRPCEHHTEATVNRFYHLPEYGNPQRVEHTVEPWIRGGDATRDYVRRIRCEYNR